VTPDETIIFANQSFCDMSGYTIEDLKGEKAIKFLLYDDDQEVLNEKLKLREKGQSDSYEIAVKNKQGEIRWWFISGAPNYNDRNELIGSIGIHLDITNQKKLEKELEKAKQQAEDASRAKESFLANMSHEIRTPLNAIIGMIRELGREELTPKQNSYVSHSETAARHLLTIVNNILDMSKIEAGELIIDAKEFSLMSVIGNVISILHSKAQEKKLELNYHISPEIKPALIGDSGRVRQILINLVGNAIKFTDAGKIDLSVNVKQTNQYFQQLSFEIKDTGIGMNKEYLNQIFNKFSQEEGSAARRYEGTGLGMTITKEMINLMGGNCEIQSEKGIGTTVTFNLTLPVGDENKLVDKDSYLVDDSLQNLKILLVEDNEMNSFIACQSLHYFGCIVDTASNGIEAIEKLAVQKPDLILMDIQMPEMDGIEATKFIRDEMAISTPIIALTANAFKRDIDLYLSIGMNDYVTKPFEENVLFNTIANTLNIRTKTPTLTNILQSKPSNETPLYDLTNIKTLSRGDQSFVNKMIEIFVEHTPTSVTEIKVAFENQDYLTISKIAHRMKPSIDNMGIHLLKNPIRELESSAKMEVVDDKKVELLIENIENTLAKVIEDLKATT
jgi:PAS domain S-box-containing protein